MISSPTQWDTAAQGFAALGDPTRLSLVTRLSEGPALSLAELTHGSNYTRQAVSKHLHVLETAGLVTSVKVGRQKQFTLEKQQVMQLQEYLNKVSGQWDEALERLKNMVEEQP